MVLGFYRFPEVNYGYIDISCHRYGAAYDRPDARVTTNPLTVIQSASPPSPSVRFPRVDFFPMPILSHSKGNATHVIQSDAFRFLSFSERNRLG